MIKNNVFLVNIIITFPNQLCKFVFEITKIMNKYLTLCKYHLLKLNILVFAMDIS